jgi:HSP20 family molecular chaperone IbpA
MEEAMSDQQQQQQELSVREKRELAAREERTVPGRFFVPSTDVYETADALTVVLEVPGVAREAVEVEVKEDVLRVEGRIDASKYQGLEPVYTEYNVGHWTRSFALSDRVDSERIEARLEDGVLTLTLPKTAAARPRRIEVRGGG